MFISLEKEFNELLSENQKTAINAAVSVAEKYNIKIYLIGGIVRDLIMQNPIKDIDITVEENAVNFSEILENESKFEVIAIQENLKTAKVRFENGTEIDFASTREERYEKAGNLPVAYNFGCELERDVKRRDFTVNTLAIDLTGDTKYSLIDYYDGITDIKNKKIKILHDKSFIDDPSRIIRALKFAARFDFEPEENTYKLMREYLLNVDKTIPLERIKNELKEYFSINKNDLYEKIIETNAYKLLTDNPVKEISQQNTEIIKPYKLFEGNWQIYWFLLILNSDSDRLNLTAEEKKVITEIKTLLNTEIDKTNNLQIHQKYNKKQNEAIGLYYILSGDETVKTFMDTLRHIKLEINGEDLINLGLKPSSYFNDIFNNVLKEKLNGKIKTKEEEINYIKKTEQI